jgi:hypothetical protein
VFAVTVKSRWPTNSAIRTQGTPRKWSSEILRWRKSCGLHNGIPSARHAFEIAVRSASAPGVCEQPRLLVPEASMRQRRLDRLGQHRMQLHPQRSARLGRGRAQPHPAA